MADPHWGPVEWHPQDAGARRETSGRGRKWAQRVLITISALTVLGLLSGTGVVVYGYTTTTRPDANAEFKTATTFVYYNDGKSELGNFAIQNRTPLPLDRIAEHMRRFADAAENRAERTDKVLWSRDRNSAVWKI